MRVVISFLLPIILWSGLAFADHPRGELQVANVENGETLYNTTCVACHGPKGKGVIPGVPNLHGKDSPLMEKDVNTLLHNVDNGFQSPGSMMAMPPRGGNASLSEQDIMDILKYMRREFGGEG
ncbi:MAG: cytochrome c [Pseudomonadales bacterium]|nr:cytochrome c [Pseudomonadales bacterium]